MTFSLGDVIQAGTLLFVILAHFVRNEMNQREIMRRLDKQNGRVDKLEEYNLHHLEECH